MNYKYIHLLYGHDTKFSKSLIALINDKRNDFVTSDHLFVTPFQNVYEELKDFGNIILDCSKKNLYRKYYKQCLLIISHGGEKTLRLLLTPKKIKKKIVYRYWGGSRISHLDCKIGNVFKRFKNYCLIFLFRKIYEPFWAIGVGTIVDIIDLSKNLRIKKYYFLRYNSNDNYDMLNSAKREFGNQIQKNSNTLNVLLGHRGTLENNHIKILQTIVKYGNSIHIFIPLSYGDKEYIESVKRFVKTIPNQNITIVDSFLNYQDYSKLLSKMDIGLFDGNTSYALGNITAMIFLRKTLFLNPTGVIAKAMDLDNAPYKDINKIGDFEYFKELITYPENFKSKLETAPIDENVRLWNEMFEDLNNYDKN